MSQESRPVSAFARTGARLAALIPGYTGYKKREHAREEDRSVREAVARQLGLVQARFERSLSKVIRELAPKEVETADKAIRSLSRQRDRVRFAPEGYASLFSRSEVGEADLESLYGYDTELWDVVESLDEAAQVWEQAIVQGERAWPGETFAPLVHTLEDALDRRESFLRS